MTHSVVVKESSESTPENPQKCSKCLKPLKWCICEELVPLDNQIYVLILQHPQEPDKDLGSARLAHLSLNHSSLKIGLSWRNLAAALGKPAQPSRWGVLYLGSGVKGGIPPTLKDVPLVFVDRNGKPVASPLPLEGLVVLDGTWTQAKALWWRNPWLLKLKRTILVPSKQSLYRELRKEPRKECLSTMESVAEALTGLGEPKEVGEALHTRFSNFLTKYRKNR